MNRSEAINELATALAKAQSEMQNASKDRRNDHFKASYASLASIIDVIRGPLSKHGLSIVQLPYEDDKGRISLETMLMHSSGQYLSATYCLQPTKNDLQGVGSAVTYMRRYSLLGLGVAPEDDDDGEGAVSRPLPQSTPYTANPAPRNGNGGSSDAKAASEKWIGTAIEVIRGFNDMADLSAFEGKYDDKIEKIKNVYPDLHDKLMGALADKYQVLSPLNAG